MADITIEELAKRVSNLERNFSAFINMNNINKSYTDAALNGVKVGVSNVTPYTETKQAYIGDESVTFVSSVNGNLSVYVLDTEGNIPAYTVTNNGGVITVTFDAPLEYMTEVTISIL